MPRYLVAFADGQWRTSREGVQVELDAANQRQAEQQAYLEVLARANEWADRYIDWKQLRVEAVIQVTPR
jgi:hypothetical protein